MKRKIFSFLFIPSILSLLLLVPLISNTNNINIENKNNDIVLNSISSPSTFTINQTYKSNKFIFDKNKTTGEFPLFSKQSSFENSMFSFARNVVKNQNEEWVYDGNSIMQNTIELDLNLWKPIGMDDDLFLNSIEFDISGYVQTKQKNQSSRLMKYNVLNNDYNKDNNPPKNINTLDTKEIWYLGNNQPLAEKKLLDTFQNQVGEASFITLTLQY